MDCAAEGWEAVEFGIGGWRIEKSHRKKRKRAADSGTDRPFVGINKWKGKFCQFVKDFEAISVEIELWFVFILK